MVGFANRNPDFKRVFLPGKVLTLGPEIIFVIVLAAAASFPAAVGGLPTWYVLIGLVAGWAVLCALLLGGTYRSYRKRSPDVILLEPDAVIGVFGRHFVGPREGASLSIPLSVVSEIKDGGYGSSPRADYMPRHIRADKIGLEGFDPKSVGELLHGPWTPVGETRLFYLTAENLARVRDAFARWSSSEKPPAETN